MDTMMGPVTQTIDSLIQLIIRLGQSGALAIASAESWMRGQLSGLGVAPEMQTVILVIFAIIMILTVVRIVGGLIRIAVLALLVLVTLDLVLPILHANPLP